MSLTFTFHYGPIQISFSFSTIRRWTTFTFHYGPIQIATVNNFKDNVAKFTFHYGPIQITFYEVPPTNNQYLHSTMVLFKYFWMFLLYIRYCIYIPLWSYSNSLAILSIIMLSIFTFHYGPIQIS